MFYNGCVIVEVRDFRRATNGTFDMQYVLLKPNTQVIIIGIYYTILKTFHYVYVHLGADWLE